jgi:hypothetical protein
MQGKEASAKTLKCTADIYYIYKLIDKDKIVHIGVTAHPAKRHRQHLSSHGPCRFEIIMEMYDKREALTFKYATQNLFGFQNDYDKRVSYLDSAKAGRAGRGRPKKFS